MAQHSAPQPGPGPRRRAARRRHRRLGVAAVVLGSALAVAGLTGCGLRLETPPPAALVPDESETVRARTVTDALAILDAAQRAATSDLDPAVAVLVPQVVAAAQVHAEAFGGVYQPFPSASPSPSPSPVRTATPPPASVAAVVTLLREAADRARADADLVTDPATARLLASVAVSRTLHAEALAAAVGEPAAPLVAVSAAVPPTAPAGLAAGDLAVLVVGHDALGLAWEVRAARTTDAERAAAAARAQAHRAAAQAWAVAAEIAGTGLDPRRAAYDLPPALTDPAADPAAAPAELASLEGLLAADYATAVAQASPGGRDPLVTGLLDAARAATASVPVPTLPGLADQAG